MPPLLDLLLLLAGAVLLYLGGDVLVRSAVRLASEWGVKPMVVGLTVVAFGTSAPELFASLLAAIAGTPSIALGNVIGSNTANVGLILGITALIRPISTHARFIRREVPFMLGVGALLLVLLLLGGIPRLAGVGLLALIALYMVMLLRGGEEADVEEEFSQEYGQEATGSTLLPWLGLVASLALLAGGAQLLVTGATGVARSLGVPELTIGLTLVAIGTSLPELFTAVIAAAKGEQDIALGNVVGSNVLNVLFILGTTALVSPISAVAGAEALWDVVIMIAFSLVLVPFLLTGLRLGRREATLLLLGYTAYIYFLFSRI